MQRTTEKCIKVSEVTQNPDSMLEFASFHKNSIYSYDQFNSVVFVTVLMMTTMGPSVFLTAHNLDSLWKLFFLSLGTY